MRNFHLIATGLDVNPLVLAIKRRPELWKEDTFLRLYPQGPFGEIETIMFRFQKIVEGLTDEEIALYKQNKLAGHDQYEAIDYPAYGILHEARPLIMGLMARVQGERLGRVFINKVIPGGRIFLHRDTDEQTRYYTRFHIVLEGLPGAILRAGDEQINMTTGDCFWFDNKQEHEVLNNSAGDRLSMVVDIKVPK